MKKITAILLSVTMGLTFIGCNGQTSRNDTGGQPTKSQDLNESKYAPGGEVVGEITVSCYDTISYKNFLDEAAKAFEEKYPGTKVNIETFSQMPDVKSQTVGGKTIMVIGKGEDNAQATDDYINKINTELMSGEGADIIAIDVIPYYKYVDSGQLENLNSYMELDESFQINDYFVNIFNAAKYKEGQYFLPIDYTFDYLSFDSSLFSESEQKPLLENDLFSYEQLIELGQQPYLNVNKVGEKDQVEMFGIFAQELFNKMWKENYNQFIDIEARTVNLNDGDFANLLNKVRDYEDRGYIKQGTKNKLGEASMGAFEKNKLEQYFYKANSSFSLLQFLNKDSKRKFGSTSQGNQENDIIAGQIEGNDGVVPYTYEQAYGLNSNSTNKTTAWAFMKFLASEEMQTSLNLFGIPVNKNALAEKTKLDITGQLFEPAGNELKTTELTSEQLEIYNNYMKVLGELSDRINTFFVQDTTINSIIDKEVENFFNGSKTSEEVTDILQNKIELYLSE